MTERDTWTVAVEIEVIEIERPNTTCAGSGVSHQQQNDVIPSGVLVPLDVVEDFLSAGGLEGGIADVLAGA